MMQRGWRGSRRIRTSKADGPRVTAFPSFGREDVWVLHRKAVRSMYNLLRGVLPSLYYAFEVWKYQGEEPKGHLKGDVRYNWFGKRCYAR